MRRTSHSSRIASWWVKAKIWCTFDAKLRIAISEWYFHRVERNEIQSTLTFSLLIFSLFSSFFNNLCHTSMISLNKLRNTYGLQSVRINHKKLVCIISNQYFFVFYKSSLWIKEKVLIILSSIFDLKIIKHLLWQLWRHTDRLPIRTVHYLVIVFDNDIVRWQIGT